MASIWTYAHERIKDPLGSFSQSTCLFCGTPFKLLDVFLPQLPGADSVRGLLHVCPICGWWQCSAGYWEAGHFCAGLASGILKNINELEETAPFHESRSYLLANYQYRYTIEPELMENIVGSIFKDFGYKTIVTSYGNDEGVDVYVIPMYGTENDVIAVQVKRYKDKIQVSSIREFLGALVLKGLTKGIFVTTSDYTKGANKIVTQAKSKGIELRLLNSEDLYSALNLTKRKPYSDSSDPEAPFYPYLYNRRSLDWAWYSYEIKF